MLCLLDKKKIQKTKIIKIELSGIIGGLRKIDDLMNDHIINCFIVLCFNFLSF